MRHNPRIAAPARKVGHQRNLRIEGSGKEIGPNPPDQGHGRSRTAEEDAPNIEGDGANTGDGIEARVSPIALPEHRGDVADEHRQNIPHLEESPVNQVTAEGPEAETNPITVLIRDPDKDLNQESMSVARDRKQKGDGMIEEPAQKVGYRRRVWV